MLFNSKIITRTLILAFFINGYSIVAAQATAAANEQVYEKVELLTVEGKRINEQNVRLRFARDELRIESTKEAAILKTFKYSEIKDAEYSYSKNPRWKTGLGLGAASVLFPPLLLVAIPIGFTKHRRHWLTIKTENDFAVLKLSKSNRKLVVPAFETNTGVDVRANGENK